MLKMTFMAATLLIAPCLCAADEARFVPIAPAWAQNSVNAVIFRYSSIVSHDGTQYAAWYREDGRMMLGKRHLTSTEWTIVETPHSGNVRDAHNAICIMVDGAGVLHVSWDHHGHPLRYCRGVAPGSLELGESSSMIGTHEHRVTYPEFHPLPNGNLLFAYRDGQSGRGNLVLNHYDLASKTWTRLHDVLLDGEGQRNAYWQMCVDHEGAVHLSWVWRESGDVATNHDLCYARSDDGGRNWTRSDGTALDIPINTARAEYAWRIPQNSELINTTSMCTDAEGHPIIASYWTPIGSEVPQYQVVWHDGTTWQRAQIGNRTMDFSLSGHGTRRIPISRCRVLSRAHDDRTEVRVIFRDIERGPGAWMAVSDDFPDSSWRFVQLTDRELGLWEPSHDPTLWRDEGRLHLYLQRVGQGQGESLEPLAPQVAGVLEWSESRVTPNDH